MGVSRRWRRVAWAVVTTFVASASVVVTGAGAGAAGSTTTLSLQGGPTHNGDVSAGLALPLVQAWSLAFPLTSTITSQGPASVPIVAGGRVFTTVGQYLDDNLL